MNKLFVVLFMCLILNPPAWADSVVIQSKKYGNVEFTPEAHAFYKKSGEARNAIQYLLQRKSCEASKADIGSSIAVQYSYACIVEIKDKTLIIYSSPHSESSFSIALLNEDFLRQIKARSDLQMLVKQKPPTVSTYRSNIVSQRLRYWYRLTLIDIKDPENLEVAKVNLAEFDRTLDEIEGK